MLSGRRAMDKNRPSGEHNLVEWARPYLTNKRKIFRVLDNRLEGQYSLDSAFRVATLAFRCLSTEPKFRPVMNEIVKELEQLQDPSKETRSSSSTGARARRRSAHQSTNRSISAVSYHRTQNHNVVRGKIEKYVFGCECTALVLTEVIPQDTCKGKMQLLELKY